MNDPNLKGSYNGGPYPKPKTWTDEDMYEAWLAKENSNLFFEDWLTQYKN